MAEFLDVVILAVLLRQLAHLHFSKIAFDRFFQKCMAGFFRRIAVEARKVATSARDVNFSLGIDWSLRQLHSL
jgi:hypothetical protein